MTQNIDANYLVFYTDAEHSGEMKRYVCMTLRYPVDLMTDITLRNSVFMYGYLGDRACYHALATSENEAELHNILAGAEFLRSLK